MKKRLFLAFAILLISASLMAQTQEPSRQQTQQQTQERVQTQDLTQSGDPIMVRERVQTRLNEGEGTMTRAERREMKRQNRISKDAAAQSRSGIQQHDRDQINKQARPMNRIGAKAPNAGTATPRTGTMQRGRR